MVIDNKLLHKRLEVCFEYNLEDGSGVEVRWSAGEVVAISDGTNCPIPGKPRAKFKAGEAAMMRWDDPWDHLESCTV